MCGHWIVQWHWFGFRKYYVMDASCGMYNFT